MQHFKTHLHKLSNYTTGTVKTLNKNLHIEFLHT